MREVAETMELAITLPGVDVLLEEYVRHARFPARLGNSKAAPWN